MDLFAAVFAKLVDNVSGLGNIFKSVLMTVRKRQRTTPKPVFLIPQPRRTKAWRWPDGRSVNYGWHRQSTLHIFQNGCYDPFANQQTIHHRRDAGWGWQEAFAPSVCAFKPGEIRDRTLHRYFLLRRVGNHVQTIFAFWSCLGTGLCLIPPVTPPNLSLLFFSFHLVNPINVGSKGSGRLKSAMVTSWCNMIMSFDA